MRERGLKCELEGKAELLKSVAPYAGAWIEIKNTCVDIASLGCRSLCGSVD